MAERNLGKPGGSPAAQTTSGGGPLDLSTGLLTVQANSPAVAPGDGAVPRAALSSGADAFAAECRQEISTSKELLEKLLSIRGERNVDNTLAPYNEISIHLSNAALRANLYANAYPEEPVRTAAEVCEREVVAFATELSLNRNLYDAIRTVGTSRLEAVTKRFLERQLRDFRRAGVDKDEATRARLKELANKEIEVGQLFDKNIRDDVRKVRLDPVQLEGLPDDFRKSHPPGPDGKVTLTTDYPDYIPFRAYAKDGAARLALFKEYLSRGYPANDAALKQLLAIRREKAMLLGYRNWADYVTEDKMIGSSRNVSSFIDRIAGLSEKRAARDYAILLERKRKDSPDAAFVDQSESTYYGELVKREQFAFNAQEVRPYFEFGRTRDGLLAITSRLFGVEYVPLKDAAKWHPDVDVYDVLADGRKLGRIYLDLHPREGKYKHAAQFPLVKGVRGRQLPEGVLVCNFPDPKTSSGPALLEHDDVVTLFHEFGHLMHHILGGHQPWVEFSGVATEWDFVEAPSQMLEEWAWDVTTLQMFARHVETGQPIPAETVGRMRAANEFGKGATVRHQMFYAAMSLKYHLLGDPAAADLTGMTVQLQGRYSKFRPVDGTHLHASFGHLNGYSAIYYTYMWSLVIAKDLFSSFEKSGLLDEANARRYREAVLVPGGSRDAVVLIRNFLGRRYRFDSFRKWLERDTRRPSGAK
ncbi:MAG: peptidase M3 [Acidobacteria bacterium]|nr:peptidase M3 [Acidobacteriota bacterium]